MASISDIFRRKSNYLIVAILTILILSIYGQTGKYPFIAFDDDVYVYENPHVLQGLTLGGVAWSFTTFHGSNWHPLTWISHMADVQLFGMNAGWHHRMSLLLHLLNTVLLYLVVSQMSGGIWRSAFVAALFGIHPLHVESVAWIAERKDLLSTFFWILSMGAYLRYALRPSIGRYLPVAIFFALGLMCKPMVVTLPFVLLLMDWWPLRRMASQNPQNSGPYSLSTFSRLTLEKIPLLGLSAISCFVTFVAQSWEGAVQPFDYIPLGIRISNAFVSYVSYLWKMVWPSSLTVFYPHPAVAGFDLPVWEIVGAALLIVAFSLLAVWQRHRRPFLTMGWLWYLGTLIPVIGIVQVGNQGMADRYTYVTLVGIFIAVAWTIPSVVLSGRFRQLLFGILGGMVIMGLSALAWQQTAYWRDNVTLFSRSLAVTKNNWLAWNNLGFAYEKLDRPQRAITYYREAIRIKPDYADPWNNIGAIYIKSGEPEQAMVYFKEALKANPYHTKALNNLAAAYYELGQPEQAITYYRKVLQAKPDYAEAWYNLGLAYLQYGQLDQAISCLREALRINPDFKEALQKLYETQNPGKPH